jgi:hypothetical protein
MTNSSRIIVAKSIDEIAKFYELHICTRTMATFWFPTEKLSQSSFLWNVKIMFPLFYLTENWNLIPHMETLFLLVLSHRKWKPCFSFFLASQKMETLFHLAYHTENGNPVSPCLSYRKWKPCFTLLVDHTKMESLFLLSCLTDMEILLLLVLPHSKWRPCFSLFCLSEKQPIMFSWRFSLTSSLQRSILFFFF